MKIQTIEAAHAASKLDDLRLDRLAQFPFAGRSNVGKSSLLNRLTGRRGLAAVSKAPGRTRKIHYYLVNEGFYFVDLPGYGYAQMPKTVREHWGRLIETYLKASAPWIPFVVVLIDIRHAAGENDAQLIEWMAHYQIPIQPVLTKADKLKRGQVAQQQRAIAHQIIDSAGVKYKGFVAEQLNAHSPIPFSAETGQGKPELLRAIDAALKGVRP